MQVVQRSLNVNIKNFRRFSTDADDFSKNHISWVKQQLDRPKFNRAPLAEPWKIKCVEHIKTSTKEYREKCMKEAYYNTFLLKSEDVYIDLLTDSGTNAMSDNMWAALQQGDEAYAGAKSFYKLWDAVKKYYGYEYMVPTHQGRGAEHILSNCLIKSGDYIPGNMYFTTTRLHQELAGGTFVDVIIDEAHNPDCDSIIFKGNVDLNKLENLVNKVGANKIPYICVAATVNMAGGQPISMENIKQVYNYCHSKNILVILDATRAVENAYFIQQYEKNYQHISCAQILKEFCSYSDGCTMSGKKDPLCNIGGWIAINNAEIYEKFCELVVIYEGLHTYGGMAGRDMEAMAIGIQESVNDDYISSRIGQVHYLGHLINDIYGVPCVKPFGGHAIYLNAGKILNHLTQDEFPAQTLASEIYIDSGVRSMERGIISAGRDHKTGKHHYPKLELVRLTIPRRVYTQAHMDVVAYSVNNVYENRKNIRGLKFIYEPKNLRFFLGRFEKL